MLSQIGALLDLEALVIVTLGTLLATFARCGWSDTKAALSAVAQLSAPTFDADANRAALARSARAIHERGLLCADMPLPPDRTTGRLLKAYLLNGSIEQLRAAARSQRSLREHACERGRRAIESAGELAPIFGLVGTLFAITQLSPSTGVSTAETTMAAVGTAVLSTMYGVLSAHLIYLPLSRAIGRRGEREEMARASLLEWFEAELSGRHDLRSAKSPAARPSFKDVA